MAVPHEAAVKVCPWIINPAEYGETLGEAQEVDKKERQLARPL